MINEEIKRDFLSRLRKIEGQIRGIQRMVERERYCIDIINQVTAAQRALDQVGLKVIQGHIESCVSDAIKSDGGDPIIGELMETIYKFIR